MKHWFNSFNINTNLQTIQNFSFYHTEEELHLRNKDGAFNAVREKIAVAVNIILNTSSHYVGKIGRF